VKNDAKVAFAKLVIEYQKVHGVAAFPKRGFTLAQLKARGHDVSPRTLQDWRRQMTNNTFGHFIQKKR
jgi:transposase-like protein